MQQSPRYQLQSPRHIRSPKKTKPETHFGNLVVKNVVLGEGCFGKVFECEDKESGESFAAKFERKKSSNLKLENAILRIMENHIGFAKPILFTKTASHEVLVQEKLGASIGQIIAHTGCFDLKTVLLMAMQLIDRFKTLHTRGIIMRDVKPENILIGGRQETTNILHLIDFGLSAFWKKNTCSSTGRMVGTPRYASINTHYGLTPSKRDDLESVGYMLVWFLNGQLPWQGLKFKKGESKLRRIGEIKERTSPAELCTGLPDCFMRFVYYSRNLKFTDTPDYSYILSLFKEEYVAQGYEISGRTFDWMKQLNLALKFKYRSNNLTVAEMLSKKPRELETDYRKRHRELNKRALHPNGKTTHRTRKSLPSSSKVPLTSSIESSGNNNLSNNIHTLVRLTESVSNNESKENSTRRLGIESEDITSSVPSLPQITSARSSNITSSIIRPSIISIITDETPTRNTSQSILTTTAKKSDDDNGDDEPSVTVDEDSKFCDRTITSETKSSPPKKIKPLNHQPQSNSNTDSDFPLRKTSFSINAPSSALSRLPALASPSKNNNNNDNSNTGITYKNSAAKSFLESKKLRPTITIPSAKEIAVSTSRHSSNSNSNNSTADTMESIHHQNAIVFSKELRIPGKQFETDRMCDVSSKLDKLTF
eukprot:TRINITY_DN241104_c0_g1_i1.p1 TRINITY_DN241104_c0_g1~~TRINITY_DN241104_c0_g1_i1.p1  ORF type:complete len:652 (+),score=130.07 TRINITY_DN241104_c0_g1_i1:110-2065(+)